MDKPIKQISMSKNKGIMTVSMKRDYFKAIMKVITNNMIDNSFLNSYDKFDIEINVEDKWKETIWNQIYYEQAKYPMEKTYR